METIYLLSGLFTVIGAIAGLALVCHLEKRALNSRKDKPAQSGPNQLSAT